MYRVVSVLIVCWAAVCTAANPDSLLVRLDGMLSNREVYESAKRAEIDEHKANYESSTTLLDRYNSLRGLYTAYRSYRIDSAMIVADARLMIAREIGDRNKIASATLNLAEAYVRSGMADKAISIMDTLDTASLERYHIKYRIGLYRTAYEAKLSGALLPHDRMEALDRLHFYSAEAARESPEGSLGYYALQAERLRDAGMHAEAVAVLEEAARSYDLSDNAGMQYTLGEMYLSAGQTDKATECLARSAIIDVSNGVKEYKALILLSSLLFESGDLDRAFRYINCAFDDSEYSRSSLRTAEVMRSMPVIDASFHAAERQMNERTNRMLIMACVLVVLLLLSLTAVIIEYRANKRMLATIARINSELENKNRELVKADSLKLQHINTLMQAYASHISRFRDFRKTVYRLLTTSQTERAVEMVKSDEVEALDIAAFHEMFDEAFLSMYPNFVEEVERYTANPVKVKSPGRLTPELRIAAILRLGIISADEIAAMMHYSVQTVYNLRSTLKGMLNVNWDDFEAYLKRP